MFLTSGWYIKIFIWRKCALLFFSLSFFPWKKFQKNKNCEWNVGVWKRQCSSCVAHKGHVKMSWVLSSFIIIEIEIDPLEISASFISGTLNKEMIDLTLLSIFVSVKKHKYTRTFNITCSFRIKIFHFLYILYSCHIYKIPYNNKWCRYNTGWTTSFICHATYIDFYT